MAKIVCPEPQGHIHVFVAINIPEFAAFRPGTNQRIDHFLPLLSEIASCPGIAEVRPMFLSVVFRPGGAAIVTDDKLRKCLFLPRRQASLRPNFNSLKWSESLQVSFRIVHSNFPGDFGRWRIRGRT